MVLYLDSLLALSFLRRWWLVLSLGLLLEVSSTATGARVVWGPVMS